MRKNRSVGLKSSAGGEKPPKPCKENGGGKPGADLIQDRNETSRLEA